MLLTGCSATSSGTVSPEVVPAQPPAPAAVVTVRDEIASRPMSTAPVEAAQPGGEVASEPSSAIYIPVGLVIGPAGVMTGFPRTPEGAVGQLGAIDVVVLGAMSIGVADSIYEGWALPGGVGAEAWQGRAFVASFLRGAEMPNQLNPNAIVVATPAGAIVKGAVGRDWTVACVLITVEASMRQDAGAAIGHCERMQWVGGRWMIGPGPEPAPAPSTWPGSTAAVDAGWLTWTPYVDTGDSDDRR